MNEKLTFIDLFAGIGGFHQALESLGMKCVFASEIDKLARKTYLANHNIDEKNFNSDIRTLVPSEIPDHDILCAGFPCQPFSQAGYKKGFSDGDNSERGNLFFCILDILIEKQPKAFILENVRHLKNHDGGKTFQIISAFLHEAGYEIFYQILKASEFGRPQHRPRIFIVGFNKDFINTSRPFNFPKPIPLKMTMSDVWEGNCSREIGFTLRVGGKGSPINDRRNWDGYWVNGEEVRLGPKQGIKMMGFPENFNFPVTKTQAMKQLGNSVCVDVVYHVAQEVIEYLLNNQVSNDKEDVKGMPITFNRGEWSEFYAFLQLLIESELFFGSPEGNPLRDYVVIFKVKHNSSEVEYFKQNSAIEIRTVAGKTLKKITVGDFLDQINIDKVFETIKQSKGASFPLPKLEEYFKLLHMDSFKGSASSKGDLLISFESEAAQYHNESVGIKSNVGSPPTLLNASSATNFIFEVKNFESDIDVVNSIETKKSKIRDRLFKISQLGGELIFIGCEKPVHTDNLRKVDSMMPEMLSELLLKYYLGNGSKLSDLVTDETKIIRMKDYLKAILLGMFSSKQWDGNYAANGSILVNEQGGLLLYHVVKDAILKDYLFLNTKLDTPSSSRHRFGNLYKQEGKLFIKLNLQIRFT